MRRRRPTFNYKSVSRECYVTRSRSDATRHDASRRDATRARTRDRYVQISSLMAAVSISLAGVNYLSRISCYPYGAINIAYAAARYCR